MASVIVLRIVLALVHAAQYVVLSMACSVSLYLIKYLCIITVVYYYILREVGKRKV